MAGQEFVITGTLAAFSRPAAASRIKSLGGITKDNVTRNTDYLVVGTAPGSKIKRAESMGIKTINEEEFLQILEKTGR